MEQTRIFLLCLLCCFMKISGEQYLPFLQLDNTHDVSTEFLQQGHSSPIITTGFPLGGRILYNITVSINGIFILQTAGLKVNSLVAPFRIIHANAHVVGNASYEMHYNSSLVDRVNQFISAQQSVAFCGSWMLISEWNQNVSSLINTFQGILITDGVHSYAVMTYQCGRLQWSGDTDIGFSIGITVYRHPISGVRAKSVACLNQPNSTWSNVIFKLDSAESCRHGFKCPSGNCVRTTDGWCNYADECRSKSINRSACFRWRCPDFQFKCQQNWTCIPQHKKCNGDHDCSDGSDEHYCGNSVSSSSMESVMGCLSIPSSIPPDIGIQNSATILLSSVFGIVGFLTISTLGVMVLVGFLLKLRKRKARTVQSVEVEPHSLEQSMNNPVYDELQSQRNGPTSFDVPREYECPISTNPAENVNQVAENPLYALSDVPRAYECPIITNPAKSVNQPVKNPFYVPTEVPNTNAQPHPSKSHAHSLPCEYAYPDPAVFMNHPEPATGASGTPRDANTGEYEQVNVHNPFWSPVRNPQ